MPKLKKLAKLILNKRAISPVLSSLLLTVVAVAAMALATTATYVISTNLRETMSERLVVEDLWFNNSTGNVDLYMHNVGKVAISISSVYFNHTSQPFIPLFLEIGTDGWLNVTLHWASGSVYYVDIVTARGTHVADYYKASQ